MDIRYLFGALLLFSMQGGCVRQAAPIELTRIPSPSTRLEAVLIEWPTNATSGFHYGLCIVNKGAPVPKEVEVLVSGDALIANSIRWQTDSRVALQYEADSKIYSFQNYWEPRSSEGVGESSRIEILLLRKVK